jgi:hypothetical protein
LERAARLSEHKVNFRLCTVAAVLADKLLFPGVQVLIETFCKNKHIGEAARGSHRPIRNVLVESIGKRKHVRKGNDICRIPERNILVECLGTVKHVGHVRRTLGIPVQRLVEGVL